MKKCKQCGKDKNHTNALISLCKECTYKKSASNKKQTRIKLISNKRKKRLSENSEVDLFMRVWGNRPHSCEICEKSILEPKTFCFAHILSKKMYPELRYFENNISLVCSIDCHQETDRRFAGRNKEQIKQDILNGKTIIIGDIK